MKADPVRLLSHRIASDTGRTVEQVQLMTIEQLSSWAGFYEFSVEPSETDGKARDPMNTDADWRTIVQQGELFYQSLVRDRAGKAKYRDG